MTNATNATSTPALSRRTLLAAGAALGATAAVDFDFGIAATGAAQTTPGRLVVLYLRGGQDHLSVTVPYTETAYYDQRPNIAVPAADVLDLDGQFGFHPAMPGLHALYGQGRVGVALATGNPAGDRSHFVAQDLSEFGDDGFPPDGLGWLARYLNTTAGSSSSLFRGVSMGDLVATSLRGHPALGVSSIDSFGLGGLSGLTAGRDQLFRYLYFGNEPIEELGFGALAAAAEVESLSGSNDADPLVRQLADLAVLLEADLGIEVATINYGGWDTHNQMGTATAGEMRDLLAGLDSALTGFIADLDQRGQADVTVLVMTEFGRRVFENGSGGTDHGWASATLVVGAGVAGGVHGTWPGIDPATTAPRFDVPVTTDFRDVLGEVAGAVLGTDPAPLFPGYTPQPLGIMA